MSFDVQNNALEDSDEYKALVAASEAFEKRFPGEYNAITEREQSLVEWAADDAATDAYERGYESAFENGDAIDTREFSEFIAELKEKIERARVCELDFDIAEYVFTTIKREGWAYNV